MKKRNEYQKEKNREWVLQDKLANPCPCGEKRPWVLTYHHKNRALKESSISALVSSGASLARLIAERAKCDVMCFNCHADFEYRLSQTGLLPKRTPRPTLPGIYENRRKLRPPMFVREERQHRELPLW